MINYKEKLVLEQAACQILFSYNYILDTFEGWEKQKAFANWRVEISEYIADAKAEYIRYIVKYLENQDSKVYIEFVTIASEFLRNPTLKNENNKFNRIINYFRGFIKEKSHEEIRSDSSVRIR